MAAAEATLNLGDVERQLINLQLSRRSPSGCGLAGRPGSPHNGAFTGLRGERSECGRVYLGTARGWCQGQGAGIWKVSGLMPGAAGPGQLQGRVCSQPQLCKLPPAGRCWAPVRFPRRQWPFVRLHASPRLSHRPAASPKQLPGSICLRTHSFRLEKENVLPEGPRARLRPTPTRDPRVPAAVPSPASLASQTL